LANWSDFWYSGEMKVGKKNRNRRLVTAVGRDAIKVSSSRASRARNSREVGCSFCFPHGYETSNSTASKNSKSWKLHRKTRYKPKVK
jgi:hypothetical protein